MSQSAEYFSILRVGPSSGFDLDEVIIHIKDIPLVRIKPFRIPIQALMLVPLFQPLRILLPLREQLFQILPTARTATVLRTRMTL